MPLLSLASTAVLMVLKNMEISGFLTYIYIYFKPQKARVFFYIFLQYAIISNNNLHNIKDITYYISTRITILDILGHFWTTSGMTIQCYRRHNYSTVHSVLQAVTFQDVRSCNLDIQHQVSSFTYRSTHMLIKTILQARQRNN